MSTYKVKSVHNVLLNLSDNRREILLKMYEDLGHIMHYAKGSTIKHQAWGGGYADHISWCFAINDVKYNGLMNLEKLSFKQDQADIVLFFHDIEKLVKYGQSDDVFVIEGWELYEELKCWDAVKWRILKTFEEEYNLYFNDDELNALKYTHGEGGEYSPTENIACPLAAHVHHCDNTSARVYPHSGRGDG